MRTGENPQLSREIARVCYLLIERSGEHGCRLAPSDSPSPLHGSTDDFPVQGPVLADQIAHAVLHEEIPADLAHAVVASRVQAVEFVELRRSEDLDQLRMGQRRQERREAPAAGLRQGGQVEALRQRERVEEVRSRAEVRDSRAVVSVEAVPDLRTRMNNIE